MKALALLEWVVLVWLFFAGTMGAVFSWVVPWVLKRTIGWAPERRHVLLLLLSASPLALTFTALFAVLLPGLGGLVWPSWDHCLAHDHRHAHLCFVHLPLHAHAGSFSLIGLVALWLWLRVYATLSTSWKAFRLVSRLPSLGVWNAQLGAWVLPTEQPVCFLGGLLQPAIFLSEGFMASTTPGELSVALSHERAHMQRGDIRAQLFARCATLLLGAKSRGLLLQALAVSAEQSADEVAAAHLGSRLQVAETILKVESLLHRASSQLAPAVAAFGSEAVPLRVASLLEPRLSAGAVKHWVCGFVGLLVLIVALNEPIHHFVEAMIALFTHH